MSLGDGGHELLRALALVLVIEGLMPFAFPGSWRSTMLRLVQLEPRLLRGLGLGSMAAGLVLLHLA